MLTRPQQILLKRAQAQAQLPDAEYRAALETVSGLPGCRSSKDARLTDRHLDILLAYVEAIYWRGVDAKALQPSGNPAAVFRQHGFWASKNTKASTSRDRFTEASLIRQLGERQAALMQLGYGMAYLQAIENKQRDASGAINLVKYLSALDRTLRFKRQATAAPANV